jgi:putative ABC transport system substrate-binding protein
MTILRVMLRAFMAAIGGAGAWPVVARASNNVALDAAFTTVTKLHTGGGFAIGAGPFLVSMAAQIAALSARAGIPTIYKIREFVAADSLPSYRSDIIRRTPARWYLHRPVAGAKPANLPIQQAAKIEFDINLIIANPLGFTVSRECLVAPTKSTNERRGFHT